MKKINKFVFYRLNGLKKINIFKIIGFIIILLVAVGVIFLSKSRIAEPVSQLNEQISQEAILIINYGEGASEELFNSQFQQGASAFDLLQKSGLDVKVKNYDIGVFIEAIGDKQNGQDNQYWMYYVNGEMPMTAADKYELKPGDKVEFRFEKSKF